MTAPINSEIASGMVTGALIFFPIRKLRLFSGPLVILTAFLFVSLKIEFGISLNFIPYWRGTTAILAVYHLIYLNYALYIAEILKKAGRKL